MTNLYAFLGRSKKELMDLFEGQKNVALLLSSSSFWLPIIFQRPFSSSFLFLERENTAQELTSNILKFSN